MREILFRGKRLDNGELVYGYLLDEINGSKPVIIQSADMEDDCSISWEYSHVDPATIGQYTGLTDKNGMRIFEGDVVRIQSKNYEVKYLLGQFFVGMNMPIAYKRFECKVIGNIHDNPELLGGADV